MRAEFDRPEAATRLDPAACCPPATGWRLPRDGFYPPVADSRPILVWFGQRGVVSAAHLRHGSDDSPVGCKYCRYRVGARLRRIQDDSREAGLDFLEMEVGSHCPEMEVELRAADNRVAGSRSHCSCTYICICRCCRHSDIHSVPTSRRRRRPNKRDLPQTRPRTIPRTQAHTSIRPTTDCKRPGLPQVTGRG